MPAVPMRLALNLRRVRKGLACLLAAIGFPEPRSEIGRRAVRFLTAGTPQPVAGDTYAFPKDCRGALAAHLSLVAG